MGSVGRDGGRNRVAGAGWNVCVCLFWFLGDGSEVLSVEDKLMNVCIVTSTLFLCGLRRNMKSMSMQS